MRINHFEGELKKLADPARAALLQRFFKTGKGQYGEGDKFLGLSVPQARAIAKKYPKLSLAEIAKFLQSPWHEVRLGALLVLVSKFQASSPGEQSEIFRFYLAHTDRVNNWDLVDLTADKIVGAHLENRDKTILYRLAQSPNLWRRRIAVLGTFHFIKNGNPRESLKIAKMLLCDPHDLIHKAVGWMLREIGKRFGSRILTDFLNKHHREMPRVMLRYAIERLPQRVRRKYLQ